MSARKEKRMLTHCVRTLLPGANFNLFHVANIIPQIFELLQEMFFISLSAIVNLERDMGPQKL